MANGKCKILICTGIFPPDIGGPASYAETLATALDKRGIEVCVLTYSRSFKAKEGNSKHNFKVVRVWGRWPIWVKHFIFGIKLINLLPKYDLIYSLNVWSAGFPSLIVSRIFRKKFIIKIVGDYAWEMAIHKKKSSFMINDFQSATKRGWINLLSKMQYWICRKADGIIVPSEYLAGMVKGWGVGSDKISIVYNGVDFARSYLSKEEARKKIGIPGNIILSSGRLVPWKGFRMLIKIMPKLLEINQFFRLVIVGDGPEKKSLVSITKNMNLDRKVYIVGKKTKEELAVYFAAADMLVLNSGYEGFSHQILEAMSAGVPVIASAIGGNKEVIKQGENGFLVRYNDEFNLTQAIKGLHESSELKDQFIAEGLKTIEKFSVDRMVEETIKLLIV